MCILYFFLWVGPGGVAHGLSQSHISHWVLLEKVHTTSARLCVYTVGENDVVCMSLGFARLQLFAKQK